LFCKHFFSPLSVCDWFYYLWPCQYCLLSFSSKFLILFCISSLIILWAWCSIEHESFCVLYWIGFTLCVVWSVYCSPVLGLFCLLCCFFCVVLLCFVFCFLLGSLLCVCYLYLVAWYFTPCTKNGFGLFVSLMFGFMFVLWIVVICIQTRVFCFPYIYLM
jgi:hypothetical protein